MTSKAQHINVDGIDYHTILDTPSSPSRGVILLTHALMSTSALWNSTITALTDAGYACLRFDHIGHGFTQVPPSLIPPPLSKSRPHIDPPTLHFDTITRHMHQLVQSVTGQTKVKAVIGCSMGGVLALRFAMLFPEYLDTDGCIIACDPPGATSLEAAKPKWSARIEQFAQSQSAAEALRKATVERWIPFPAGEDASSDAGTVAAREQAMQMVKSCSLDGYRLCADGIRGYGYDSELWKVKARTMVLVGELDEAVGPREVTEGIAKKIKGARYVWMLGTGHVPPLHRPQEFEDIVLGFLNNQVGTKL